MDKPRLLIVEDENHVVADISVILTQMGYVVAGSTACGRQAVAMAEEVAPDLVIMDMHLGGELDGIEAAKEMRGRLHLPVVFLAAYGEDETFQRAKEAEPFGYILKPFEERELRIVIEMALYKHQAEAAMREKYAELERFNKITVDRELRMIELKQEINGLLREAGQSDKYRIIHES